MPIRRKGVNCEHDKGKFEQLISHGPSFGGYLHKQIDLINLTNSNLIYSLWSDLNDTHIKKSATALKGGVTGGEAKLEFEQVLSKGGFTLSNIGARQIQKHIQLSTNKSWLCIGITNNGKLDLYYIGLVKRGYAYKIEQNDLLSAVATLDSTLKSPN